MERHIKRLPDLELEAMLAIWESDTPLHTGEIHQRLSAYKKRPLQVIQTILNRLEEKGFVSHEKIGRYNYFSPLIQEETYRISETASFIEKLYKNSPVQLVASLVKNENISDDELAEIKHILDGEEKL